MIQIKCSTKDTIRITDMVPFQGNLKKRTQQDIDQLKESLLREGLLMPFAIWEKPLEQNDSEIAVVEQNLFLLDGHGRKEAIIQMAVDEPSLLTVDWPCVFIKADTEDDARKALLQITSSYGKITKIGVKQFTVSIPDYVAPSIKKFVESKPKENKDSEEKENKTKHRIIRIKVPEDKMNEVINIFKVF